MSRPVLRRVYTEKEIDCAAMDASWHIAGFLEKVGILPTSMPARLRRQICRDIADWFRVVQPRQKVLLVDEGRQS